MLVCSWQAVNMLANASRLSSFFIKLLYHRSALIPSRYLYKALRTLSRVAGLKWSLINGGAELSSFCLRKWWSDKLGNLDNEIELKLSHQ